MIDTGFRVKMVTKQNLQIGNDTNQGCQNDISLRQQPQNSPENVIDESDILEHGCDANQLKSGIDCGLTFSFSSNRDTYISFTVYVDESC